MLTIQKNVTLLICLFIRQWLSLKDITKIIDVCTGLFAQRECTAVHNTTHQTYVWCCSYSSIYSYYNCYCNRHSYSFTPDADAATAPSPDQNGLVGEAADTPASPTPSTDSSVDSPSPTDTAAPDPDKPSFLSSFDKLMADGGNSVVCNNSDDVVDGDDGSGAVTVMIMAMILMVMVRWW